MTQLPLVFLPKAYVACSLPHKTAAERSLSCDVSSHTSCVELQAIRSPDPREAVGDEGLLVECLHLEALVVEGLAVEALMVEGLAVEDLMVEGLMVEGLVIEE